MSVLSLHIQRFRACSQIKRNGSSVSLLKVQNCDQILTTKLKKQPYSLKAFFGRKHLSKSILISGYDDLDAAARRVAFFNCLREMDREQYELFLGHCQAYAAHAGQYVICQGDSAMQLFFIVSGCVDVSADGHYLGTLPAGETFGDMAMFVDAKRKASIKASEDNSAPTLLLALDISLFGELQDFSAVSRASKLLFYRMHIQRARWRLEKNRIQFPHHPFFERMQTLTDVAANDDDMELEALHQQAVALTHMLLEWNALGIDFGSIMGATGE